MFVTLSVTAIMSTSVRLYCKAAFLVLLLCFIAAEIAAAEEVPVDPPDRVARLSYTDGEVSVAPAGTDTWAEAVLNRPLTSGDRISVESGARAELQVDSAMIHLDSNSGFSFLELDDNVMQMSLTEGVATVHVFNRGEDETLQVETPNGRVSLLHPGEYTIEVNRDDDETVVKVRSGGAEVVADDERHAVDKGEALAIRGAEEVDVDSQRLGDRSSFERWASERADEREGARSSRYVSSGVIGYEDLDRNGDWIYEREYGYIWQPTYIAVDWAPYRYGRWVWIAPWGYTWIDDARWGFAPFHYGRWAQVRNRWCWVPGPRHLRPVYSPALVGWTGGGGTRVGWFPLGPRDVFVPGYRHSPRYIRRVNEGNTRFINYRDLRTVDSRTGFRPDYRFARNPGAITVVDRDRFLAGRSIVGARVNVDHDVNRWRPQARPPALTPYRESVLGGTVRPNVRELHDNDRQRADFPRYRTPTRIPFDTERRSIEANGGQPPSRAELRDGGPKHDGDFRGGAWREQRSPQGALHTAESEPATPAPRALHELGTVRPPLPSGERTWHTQRPDSSERESVNADRSRQHDDSIRYRTPTRTWNSSGSGAMREHVQRERDTPRMQEPRQNVERNVGRSAPARVERSEPSAPRVVPDSSPQSPSRGDGPGRGMQQGQQSGRFHTR